MSCEKRPWTELGASSRRNFAADGDNPRPSLDTPSVFLEAGSSYPGWIFSYSIGDRPVVLVAYPENGQTRFKAIYENGVHAFDLLQSNIPTHVAEKKGWLISRGESSIAIYSAVDGHHIGNVALSGKIYESNNGDVVVAHEREEGNVVFYDFYSLFLDEAHILQSNLEWTSSERPITYDPSSDNLIFPQLGQSKELLTGEVAWSFPIKGDWSTTVFDYKGNAYLTYSESVPAEDYTDVFVHIRKLSFPEPPPGEPGEAVEEWTLDLTQYIPNDDFSEVWGGQAPQYPRNVCVTEDYLWFFQVFIKKGQKGQYLGIGGENLPDNVIAHLPWHETFYTDIGLVKVRTDTGEITQNLDLPDVFVDHEEPNSFVMRAASNDEHDWAITNVINMVEPNDDDEFLRYISSLYVLLGPEVTGNALVYEVDYDEFGELPIDPREYHDTLLPHGELAGACIVGGSVYYFHRETDGTHNVRRMGLHYRCDSRRKAQANPDPCHPPGPVSLLGDTHIPAGSDAESTHTSASSEASDPPRSMGYGWYLDSYKKLLIGPEALEFIDGTGGYQQWELFDGEWLPVHRDNFIKAVEVNGDYELTFPDYSKMLFDDHGKLKTWTDRSGNALTYDYDEPQNAEETASARLREISDNRGRRTLFRYQTEELSDRQPIEVVELERGSSEDGRTTTLEYDPVSDQLISVTQPNGDKTEYEYNEQGQMWKTYAPGHRLTTEFEYDDEGRVESATFNGVMKHTYTYEPEERKTSVTMIDLEGNSPSRTTTYEYDINYKLIKEIDPLGNVTETKYEDARHPTLPTLSIAPNLATTKWTYNALGNVTSVIDTQNNITEFQYAEDVGPFGEQYENLVVKVKQPLLEGGERPETNFTYDSLGRVKTVTDAENRTTEMTYGAFGVVTKVKDHRGVESDFSYESGTLRLQSISIPTGRSSGDIVTTFEYNSYDEVEKVENNLGHFVETKYDSLGRPQKVWDPLRAMTEYHYEDGFLKEIDTPSNFASGTGVRRTTRMNYDGAARVSSIDRQTGSDQFQMRVGYGYDGFSQLRELRRLKDAATQTYEFDYDILGRQTELRDPSGHTSSTDYEKFCKRYAQTSARGIRTTINFDDLCRLTQVDVGDPGDGFSVLNKRETRTFSYDNLGRMTKSRQGQQSSFGTRRYAGAEYGDDGLDISGDGGERSYFYDKINRTKQIVFEDGSNVSYAYDDLANSVLVTETASATTGAPEPRETLFEYWDDGLLKRVTVKRSGQADRVFYYHYDSIGRMERIVYPSETGIEVHFDDGASGSGWDLNGRLRHMRYEKGGQLLRAFEFDYDESGNRTIQVDTSPVDPVNLSGPQQSVHWNYEYDWLDRLTKVLKSTDGGTPLEVSVYHYDESDNRTKFELPQDILEFVYSYNESNELENLEKKSGSTVLFTESFVYDDDGNLTTRTKLEGSDTLEVSYEWNDFNRLLSVSSTMNGSPSNEAKQDNIYGVNGFRRKKTKKSGEIVTEYAEGLSTAVAKSTASTTTYIQAHGLTGFERDGNFYYFVTDALGSVRDLVNSSGTVIQRYEFNENGTHIVSPMMGGASSDKTFVGGMSVNDDLGDSGLYMMGHRYYDPELGRFLSRDPIGHQGGLNLYAYAGNSPASRVDPDGLEDIDYGRMAGSAARGVSRIRNNLNIAAFFIEPIDWTLSAEDIYENGLSGWHLIGLAPIISAPMVKQMRKQWQITKNQRIVRKGAYISEDKCGNIITARVDGYRSTTHAMIEPDGKNLRIHSVNTREIGPGAGSELLKFAIEQTNLDEFTNVVMHNIRHKKTVLQLANNVAPGSTSIFQMVQRAFGDVSLKDVKKVVEGGYTNFKASL